MTPHAGTKAPALLISLFILCAATLPAQTRAERRMAKCYQDLCTKAGLGQHIIGVTPHTISYDSQSEAWRVDEPGQSNPSPDQAEATVEVHPRHLIIKAQQHGFQTPNWSYLLGRIPGRSALILYSAFHAPGEPLQSQFTFFQKAGASWQPSPESLLPPDLLHAFFPDSLHANLAASAGLVTFQLAHDLQEGPATLPIQAVPTDDTRCDPQAMQEDDRQPCAALATLRTATLLLTWDPKTRRYLPDANHLP